MKILAFAASNSPTSINKQLVQYALNTFKGDIDSAAEVELLDLNDYEMPIYRADREKNDGIPEQARTFFEKIGAADALIISFAEHNGSYTAAYKNLFDWTSRINSKVFQHKMAVLLATSPGPGGAGSVLKTAATSAPYFGMDVKATLSVPSFYDQFDMATGTLKDPAVQQQVLGALKSLV